jgi:hypothetical protein
MKYRKTITIFSYTGDHTLLHRKQYSPTLEKILSNTGDHTLLHRRQYSPTLETIFSKHWRQILSKHLETNTLQTPGDKYSPTTGDNYSLNTWRHKIHQNPQIPGESMANFSRKYKNPPELGGASQFEC